MNEDPTRTLSDSDIEAIAKALQDTLIKQFYSNLGKGVWAGIRHVVVIVLLAIAAYGAAKENHIFP